MEDKQNELKYEILKLKVKVRKYKVRKMTYVNKVILLTLMEQLETKQDELNKHIAERNKKDA